VSQVLAGRPGGRRIMQIQAVGLYFAGTIVGGMVLGACCGAIGMLLPVTETSQTLVVTLLLMSAWITMRDRNVPFQVRKQVPRGWTAWDARGMALAFGFLLGLGVVTFLESAGMYIAVLGIVAIGSPISGIAVGAIYGLFRALPVLFMLPESGRGVELTLRPTFAERVQRGRRSLTIGLAAAAIGIAVVMIIT
jgi:hypothetical protein